MLFHAGVAASDQKQSWLRDRPESFRWELWHLTRLREASPWVCRSNDRGDQGPAVSCCLISSKQSQRLGDRLRHVCVRTHVHTYVGVVLIRAKGLCLKGRGNFMSSWG